MSRKSERTLVLYSITHFLITKSEPDRSYWVWHTFGEGNLLVMRQYLILQGKRTSVEEDDVKHGSETSSGPARGIGTHWT
jgi:hypothetical protein